MYNIIITIQKGICDNNSMFFLLLLLFDSVLLVHVPADNFILRVASCPYVIRNGVGTRVGFVAGSWEGCKNEWHLRLSSETHSNG